MIIPLLEDPRKRLNIAYYNSFERMEARLRNHVTAMPKIINDNLVQVYAYFVVKIPSFFSGSTSCQRGSYEPTDSDRILCSGEKVTRAYISNISLKTPFSKLIMAEFWYQTVLPMFGNENVTLLYSGLLNCLKASCLQ